MSNLKIKPKSFRSGFVAIIGRPNVGKSTLTNKVLGTSISIVTPKAQTTREKVLGILSEVSGQIVFVDTPGIHTARAGSINSYMVSQAQEALEGTELVWYLVDPSSGLTHENAVLQKLKGLKCPVFLILNKCDLKYEKTKGEQLIGVLVEELSKIGLTRVETFFISALKQKGVEELLQKTWALMPEGPKFYEDMDQVSDRPVKFFVAEKIREQLFLCLGEEIPYSCAVEIEKFDEKAKVPRIEAMIYVERDSQKGMVVGKGGAKIKEIGQKARQQIEKFMGQHVFLGLRVKVLKDWTKDSKQMERLGYNLNE